MAFTAEHFESGCPQIETRSFYFALQNNLQKSSHSKLQASGHRALLVLILAALSETGERNYLSQATRLAVLWVLDAGIES